MEAVKFMGQSGIVVKVPNIQLEAGTIPNANGFTEVYSAYKFLSENIIILTMRGNSPNTLYLTYMSATMQKRSVIIPNTFKLLKIRGKIKTELDSAYERYSLDNLHLMTPKGTLVYSCGSDPEIFLEDDKGIVIPAFDFLGSKERANLTSPKPLIEGGSHEGPKKLYWDGFQAEFETFPATCLAWQIDSIQNGLEAALQFARKHNPTAKLSLKTVMDIPQEMLEKAKDEHVQFGCMPSFNAYGMKGEQIPGREVPFRPAGGHIHLGLANKNNYTEEQFKTMVKGLDAILGVACVSLFAKFDDPRRRRLYGLAGEYRTPAHGLEYRVLSNAWMSHPLIANLVFELARAAVTFAHKGLLKHWKSDEEQIIHCINTCDVALARKILSHNKNVFYSLIKACYNSQDKDCDLVFNIFMKGMESIIDKPEDIAKNWELEGKWVKHGDGTGKNYARAIDLIRANKKVA